MSPRSDRCVRFLSVISDLVSGDATPEAAREADDHRKECTRCAAELSLALAIEERLTTFPEYSPPEGLWDKIEARIEGEACEPQRKKRQAPQPAGTLVRLPARS